MARLVNTQVAYGRVFKLLHWLIAFLIIGMLFLGYFMFDIPDKSLRGQVIGVHKLTGLSILILMILRVTWALTHPKPLALSGGGPFWQRIVERTVHYSLYAILIVMPVTGWLMSVAFGHAPKLYSLTFALPIEQSKAVGEYWEGLHKTLAIVIIALISLHILAAFYHYFVKKDQVLQRML